MPNDFSGTLLPSDGLPEGTTLTYRFASLKPLISSNGNSYLVYFGNATVTIPLTGEPTLETYDIFECVVTINGQTHHLEG